MVVLKHPTVGIVKECPTGYSWKIFFFSVFYPLCRGDIRWAAILTVLCVMASAATVFVLGLGALLVPPIFAAFYNKLFITELLEKGYIPANNESETYLVENGYLTLEKPSI